MLKLDLHIHSQYSVDAKGTPREIIQSLKKKGINGMCITDHNTVKGSLEALKISPKNFIIIPGAEISTLEGHILALNIGENILPKQSLEITIEKIIDEGGIPIIPHVYRNMSGIKKRKLNSMKEMINTIEVFNSCSQPLTNLKMAKIAKNNNFGGTGGSDTHEPQYAGYGYTTIDTNDENIDNIISQINYKKTWGEGITLPMDYRRNRMIKSVKQFFQRGFKRI
ncbi:MAG: PHP domain-containing protein [Thermoplasmatales archaeon]|nr:PHP domain-containing protein [Thermoplasmatales archaeon]